MEVGNINQGGQSILPLNVSSPGSTTNPQGKGQEVVVVNVGTTEDQYIGEEILTNKYAEKAVEKLNKLLEDKETYAEYIVYGKSKDVAVRIVNKKTREVVQELPPKKIIDMVDKLCELAGIFVDKKV